MKLTGLDIPRVETKRLVLRGHALEDFPAIRDMWSHPGVTKYIGGKPRPEEECWLKFLRAAGFWAHLGYGYWIIEERDSGAVVGEVGFGDFKRDIDPPLRGAPEIGWALAAPFHGKGYGYEAARGAVDWGDANSIASPMSCIVDPANTPSIRIAEKCGFSEITRTAYHGDEVILFHRR